MVNIDDFLFNPDAEYKEYCIHCDHVSVGENYREAKKLINSHLKSEHDARITPQKKRSKK